MEFVLGEFQPEKNGVCGRRISTCKYGICGGRTLIRKMGSRWAIFNLEKMAFVSGELQPEKGVICGE